MRMSASISTIYQHNIPTQKHRVFFDFLGRRERLGDDGGGCLFRLRAQIQKERVFFVERLVRKKHLRHEPVGFAFDIKMTMRRTKLGRADRICAGLDCFETITPFAVRRYNGTALKIRVERRSVRVGRVCVTSVRVRLPNFDFRARDRLAFLVENSSRNVNDFTRRKSGFSGN